MDTTAIRSSSSSSATVVYRGEARVLPLERLTVSGLCDEFGVSREQFPYLKTATSVHEPLQLDDDRLYGLLDGAVYTLVLADRTQQQQARRKRKVLAPSLRGVQRLRDEAAEVHPAASLYDHDNEEEDDDDDDLDVALDEVPPPSKRLKSSSAMQEDLGAEHTAPTTTTMAESLATMLPDDLDADMKLEEESPLLSPEQVFAQLTTEPRVRMAPSHIQAVYEFLRPDPRARLASPPPKMTTKLFPYQLAAIAWMVDREHESAKLRYGIGAGSHAQAAQFPELLTPGGVRSPPFFHLSFKLSNALNIQVLADEVGLGKTLETVGLVLSHPRPSSHDRHNTQASIKDVSATLIVAPPFLLAQWEQEINKHCESRLRVFSYEGMEQTRKNIARRNLDEYNENLEPEQKKRKRLPSVSDAELAAVIASGTLFLGYDIVLTSYDILRNEVHFDGQQSRRLRSGALFRSMSPLRSVRWWRVCMDEVQQIKGAQSLAAQMCREIPAVHRWGISGTPIKHSFHDLHGLLVFLGVEKIIWQLSAPEILLRLRPLFWRHSQHHVIDHLNIPQVQQTHIEVRRSPFEVYCRRKLEARFSDLPMSFWAKFDSAPFDVTFNHLILRPGQKRTQTHAPNTIDFEFIWTSLVNMCTTEFRSLHIDLTQALTDLALVQLQRGSAQLESASKNIGIAMDIIFHRRGETFDKLIDIQDSGFQMEALSTPAAQVAAFRASSAFADICKGLGLQESAAACETVVAQKTKCLAESLAAWSRSMARFKQHRTEAGVIRRNGLVLNYREPWWRRFTRWMREESEEFRDSLLQRLRNGFSTHVDTKLMGGVEVFLKYPEASLELVEDILDRHLSGLDTLRSKLVKRVAVTPPSTLCELLEFEQSLLVDLDNLLTAYSEHQVSPARTVDAAEHKKRTVSHGEVLLLEVERLVIYAFNQHFAELTKLHHQQQAASADLQRRVDFLGQLCYEAGAQFRQLELNKLELLEASNAILALKNYCSILRALEDAVGPSAIPAGDLESQEQRLSERVQQLMDRCLRKKDELRFLGKHNQQTDPSSDRFGSKQSKAIKRLRHVLGRSQNEKALVFSAHSETIVQFTHLLGLGYTPIRSVSGRGIQGVGSNQGSFVSRIKQFQYELLCNTCCLSPTDIVAAGWTPRLAFSCSVP